MDGTLFDSVEPHRFLPKPTRDAFWKSCQFVNNRPVEFVPSAARLEREFAEDELWRKWRRGQWHEYRASLRSLQNDSPFCRRQRLLAKALWLRNMRTPPGRANDKQVRGERRKLSAETVIRHLRRERVHEAILRGERLNGTQLTCRTDRSAYPSEILITPQNVDLVFAWEAQQYKRQKLWRKKEWVTAQPYEDFSRLAARLQHAIRCATTEGLPAGPLGVQRARKVLLLACLASYPHPLPGCLRGDFFSWQWEDVGSWYRLVEAEMNLDGKRKPLPRYVGGRNCVIFGHPLNHGERNFEGWENFADLIERSLNLLAIAAPTQQLDPHCVKHERAATAIVVSPAREESEPTSQEPIGVMYPPPDPGPSSEGFIQQKQHQLSPSNESSNFEDADDAAFLPPRRIAELSGVPYQSLRGRLNRWRARNGSGWMENPDRSSREAQFLYRVGSIRHIVASLLDKKMISM